MIEEKTRVILHTGDRMKWADGKTGVVCRTAKAQFDPSRDNLVVPDYFMVKIDGMDPSKPPFGLAGVYENEMEVIPEKTEEEPKDSVNHPSHYTDGKYECIAYMESKGYTDDGYLFNAVKYISRAGKKDPSKFDEDLDKAIWYLNRRMERDGKEWTDYISTKDYIQDKGLDGTALGLALELIERQDYELAVKVLSEFRNAKAEPRT